MKLLCWMDEDFHFTFHHCTIASLWSNSFHEWSFIHLVCFIVNSYLRLCFNHVCLILLFQQANFFSFLFSHFPKFFSFSPCLSLSSSHFSFSLSSFLLIFSFPWPMTTLSYSWVSFIFPFHLWSRSCVFNNQLELSKHIILLKSHMTIDESIVVKELQNEKDVRGKGGCVWCWAMFCFKENLWTLF